MILFYRKSDGHIIGTIDGRVHPEEHMNMWVGDKELVGRLVCNWIPDGNGDFFPEVQPEIFAELETHREKLKDYKVDMESNTLVHV